MCKNRRKPIYGTMSRQVTMEYIQTVTNSSDTNVKQLKINTGGPATNQKEQNYRPPQGRIVNIPQTMRLLIDNWFWATSTGGVSIQLSDARLASKAGENMRSSSSSSSPWYHSMLRPRTERGIIADRTGWTARLALLCRRCVKITSSTVATLLDAIPTAGRLRPTAGQRSAFILRPHDWQKCQKGFWVTATNYVKDAGRNTCGSL